MADDERSFFEFYDEDEDDPALGLGLATALEEPEAEAAADEDVGDIGSPGDEETSRSARPIGRGSRRPSRPTAIGAALAVAVGAVIASAGSLTAGGEGDDPPRLTGKSGVSERAGAMESGRGRALVDGSEKGPGAPRAKRRDRRWERGEPPTRRRSGERDRGKGVGPRAPIRAPTNPPPPKPTTSGPSTEHPPVTTPSAPERSHPTVRPATPRDVWGEFGP